MAAVITFRVQLYMRMEVAESWVSDERLKIMGMGISRLPRFSPAKEGQWNGQDNVENEQRSIQPGKP